MTDSSLFADFSSFSSPLEQVFGNVPKGHDKALRQAIYNVLVSALFCVLAWAVYYVLLVVLEPFLVPLFWAVLTGFVIHPYKTKFADVLRKWIANLDNHEKPAVISGFLGCLTTLEWSCESIGSKIISKWKLVIALGVALPIYHFVIFYPLDIITPSLIYKAWHAFKFVEFISLPMLVTCMSSYCISVILLWNEERQLFFQIVGVAVWTVFALYVINLFWPPLWMLGSVLGVLYAFTKISKLLELEDKNEDEVDARHSKQIRFRQAVLTILNRMNSTYGNIVMDNPDKGPGSQPSASSTPNINRIEKIEHPGVSALKKPFVRKIMDSPAGITDTPLSSSRLGAGGITNMKLYRTAILKRSSSIELGTSQESNSYIRIVLWSCLVVQLFIRPYLLHFLPIPISYAVIKKFWGKISSLEAYSIVESQKKRAVEFLKSRKQALIPWPVNKFASELYKIERSLIRTIPNFVDTIVTILLILAIILGLVMTVIFVSAQMYTETVYIVQTSGKLVTSVTTSSLFQQLNESIGGHNQSYFKGSLDDVMDSGYRYGRKYISSSVVSIFKSENNDNQDSVDEFENKLLELWDRIYQYWLSQNMSVTSSAKSPNVVEYGPQVSQEAITTSVEEVVHRVLAILDLSAFGQFTLNNTGTLISILDQGWSLLKGNLSFALTIISEILRILFHSGSGMVNFVLSLIVYFTALFYLLSSSGNVYKPVEMISQYSGMVMGTGFASALNKAINSVFTVTFKMATFYGLWTYLTHTIFSASIKTVPVLVATFLATVPVAGQYLVALPAALELWLVEERSISAFALLLCHILPTYVIDAAIYAEVRQGIHPWITGLSIVGGVYYFGITGAIYGPLFLCGMYVILSVYTGWLQDIPLETNKSKVQQQQPMVTPLIKRSESVY